MSAAAVLSRRGAAALAAVAFRSQRIALRLASSSSSSRLKPVVAPPPAAASPWSPAVAAAGIRTIFTSPGLGRSVDDQVEVESPHVVFPAPTVPESETIAHLPTVSHDYVLEHIPQKRTTILDVRTTFEAEVFGSIPSSVLIPHEKLEYAMELTGAEFKLEFGFYKPHTFGESIILYCRSGPRAKIAGMILQEQFGFHNVMVYEKGWVEWEQLHPEDVKKKMPPTPEEVFEMMTAGATLKKRRSYFHQFIALL